MKKQIRKYPEGTIELLCQKEPKFNKFTYMKQKISGRKRLGTAI